MSGIIILKSNFQQISYFLASLMLHGLLVVGLNRQSISLSQFKKALNQQPILHTTELSFHTEKIKEIKKEVRKETIEISPPATPMAKPLKPVKEHKKKVASESTYVTDLSRNQDQTPEELRAFFTNLIEEIHRKKRYPTLSKRLRESGVVHIKFEVSSDGKVKNASLKKPCTYKRLNKSALWVVSNLELTELPPKNYGKIEITFPINYIL